MEYLSLRRKETQIRDVEIIYKALATYYWKGNVRVFSSFQSLPRGRGVPDAARVIFKQESYDVLEQGQQRYPLRLLVNTPDLSCMMAQKAVYPDNQVTFLISSSTNGTNCAILFYVYTTEGDRRMCCPYSAGLSLLLMNTEISGVLNLEESSARDTLLYDVIPLLPMHKAGFQKSDQAHLHGFLIMKEVHYSPEQERRDVMYWRTKGLNSQVDLTKDCREATCCRYSLACDDISVVEERMTDLSVRHTSETDFIQPHIRASSMSEKKSIRIESEDLSQSYKLSTVHRNYSLGQNSPDVYSIFVRDTTLIWSAFYRYVLGHESHTAKQNTLSAYLASNTLLPYYPSQTGASQSELQVPFDMRRSFRARTHNEIREGFPTCVFVNPDTMVLASNTQAPPYQATYFLEFQEASRVATPCYVLKSAKERYLVMPSYHEEAKNQLKITLSENLASHIDQQQTEAAIAGLANTVLPNLLPKLDMENSLFQMHGTMEQFYLLKQTPHKYYYWKVKPENNTVSMTINSTEASLFQISM